MQKYQVELTDSARRQLRTILEYLIFNLRNEQAYYSVKEDFLKTVEKLEYQAGIIAESEYEYLRIRNLRRMHFLSHRYVLLFRIYNEVVYIVEIYHESEDYINNRI